VKSIFLFHSHVKLVSRNASILCSYVLSEIKSTGCRRVEVIFLGGADTSFNVVKSGVAIFGSERLS
jgi:hypothetical protein